MLLAVCYKSVSSTRLYTIFLNMTHNSVRLIFFYMQSIAQKKVLVYMHLFVGGVIGGDSKT